MARTKKRLSSATDHGPMPETPDMQDCDAIGSPRTEKVKRVRRSEEKNGWIKSIELTDFMCHRHTKVNLNSSINFITGNNGSGKSAILTALTVCLGGRASTTQRATSLSALVREGAETASVRVTLCNAGDANAYRPDKYGDIIVVERRFGRQAGQSRFLTFGSAGRIVSEKKEEISQICDHFSIQVDNPLAVLSQETAKKFLASAKPQELYEFFMKATQLEQLAFDYMYAKDRVRTAETRIAAIRSTWSAKESRIKELEQLVKDVARQKDIRQSLKEIRGQLGWSRVEEQEAAIAGCEEEEGRKEGQLGKLEEDREKIVERSAGIQEEIARLQAEANSFNVDLQPLQRAHDELVGEKRRLTDESKRLEMDLKDLSASFKEENNNLSRIQSQLDEEIRRQDNSNQAKIREEIEQLGEEIRRLNGEQAEGRKADGELRDRRGALSTQITKARELLEEAKGRYDSKRHALEQAKRANGSKLSAYGDRLHLLLQDIANNASLFHRQPVGPMGLHVELTDKSWSLPVEVIIGKELDAFIVKDQHDHDQLRKLMARHHHHAPIQIIRSDDPIDFRNGEPDAHIVTALRLLKISHPLVLKALIITCSIERAGLFPDRNTAKDALRRERNVDSAFTPTNRVFVNGSSHSSTALYSSGKIGLIQDNATRLNELEQQVKDLYGQAEALSRDKKRLEDEAVLLQQDITRNEAALGQTERQIRSSKTRLQVLEGERASAASLTYSSCEDQKRNCQEALERLTAQAKALTEQISAAATRIATIQEQIDENEAGQQAIRDQFDEVMDSVHKASTFRRSADAELSKIDQRKTYLSTELATIKHRQGRLQAELAEMVSEISKISPRIPITSSKAELEQRRLNLQSILDELVRSQPDPATLLQELTSLKDSLAKSQRLIDSEDHLMQKMSMSLQKREGIWDHWRASIMKLSNMEFILMLQARGFLGRLDYNVAEKLLSIRVKPRAQVISDAVAKSKITSADSPVEEAERDICQLSGGEKSYSTACFLFSLWTAMSSPLRALDEFDVFMDQVNRDFVIRELVKNARSSKVQFILITPNAIWNSIKMESDIKIIRLENPDRRQGVLA